eukprot:TRINITY_DN17910_c0_g1_i1.p1 TRINITY_DN17910_c0_g1~~TRINITY_DN17910_c0_g1_i1.p1  ORF type:complete len:144 (-),score=46.66 TRINITY_DN17910_c0_g1_i1:59-457(-)
MDTSSSSMTYRNYLPTYIISPEATPEKRTRSSPTSAQKRTRGGTISSPDASPEKRGRRPPLASTISETPGSQTLLEFRTSLANGVFELTVPTARRLEERMRKIEETLGNLQEMLKLEQKSTVDLKLLKSILE